MVEQTPLQRRFRGLEAQLDQLEHLMRQLTGEHDRLLDRIRRKQQAVRGGEPGLIEQCCKAENELVQRIAEIEKRRQNAVGEITGHIAPDQREPLTLSRIAESVEEPRRGRLLMLRRELREAVEAVRRENDVARRATEGLLAHVQGVMQQVTHALTSAGTYGSNGTVDASAAAVSSFAITG